MTLFPPSVVAVLAWCRTIIEIGEAHCKVLRARAAATSRRIYQRNIEKNRAYGREHSAAYRAKHPIYQAEYQKRNRQRINAWMAAHRKKYADRYLDQHLQREYGISLDEYKRLLIQQGGGCAICGRRAGGSKNGGVRLHVDHDHATGKPRGLLCGTCNRGIGQLGDDARRVRAAVRYLESRRPRESAERLAPLFDEATNEVETIN